MVKKGFVTLQTAGIIAAVILAAIAASQLGLIPADISGFSTLSVSQVDFQSNDPILNKPAWVISLVLNGRGQSVTGTIDNAQVTDEGKQALQDFTISMNLKENHIQYPVIADTTTGTSGKVYTTSVYIIDDPVGTIFSTDSYNKFLNVCKTYVNGGYEVIKPTKISGKWYCLQKFEYGTKGKLSPGNEIFSADISLNKGGQTTTVTINNVDKTAVFLDSVAHAQWQGNLVSGQQLPSESSTCAVWTGVKWNTASCSSYESWETAYTSYPSCLLTATTTGGSADSCSQLVNQRANTFLQGTPFTAGYGAASTTGTLQNGIVDLPLQKQFSFPLMTLRVNADYIGIYQPVGMPQIVAVSSEKFRTGTTGTIKATVRNIGQALGGFDISAVCNAPFTSNDRTTISLNPGQQSDVYLRVDGQSTQLINGLCTVKAFDINNPNNVATAQVTVTVDTIVQCTSSEIRVEGRYLKKCRADGGGWDVIKTCPENTIVDATTFECKGTAIGGGPDLLKGIAQFFANIVGGLIIGIFAIIAVYILAIGLGIKALSMLVSDWKRAAAVVLIIALIAAVMFTGLSASVAASVIG